jgi:hypothetical protein
MTMGSTARNHDDTELLTRTEHSDPIRVDSHEVRYLDMSGDGVPDAVERISRSAFRGDGSDFVDTVEETRRLEYGIGVTGTPAGVAERTTVSVRDASGRQRIVATADRGQLARSA